MLYKNYKDLDVWKKGIEIADEVYNITDGFPQNERYGLSQHLQKTAVSIPSNIAEGSARQYAKEFIQFLYISLGSCAELETQLVISYRRKYISQKKLEDLQESMDHENRMIMNLIKSLK